jgi:hypothetical protein
MIRCKTVADRGYVSQNLFEKLFVDGIHLITRLKKNMRNSLMSIRNKIYLRKRSLIDTVNDELKNICQIEHTRRRCFENFIFTRSGFETIFTGIVIPTSVRSAEPTLVTCHDQSVVGIILLGRGFPDSFFGKNCPSSPCTTFCMLPSGLKYNLSTQIDLRFPCPDRTLL